ncbi:MAG TPA: translocation/assembly module TamB domain-containing protein [Candidatus Cryosericum sp.]|nr:translocation/assembly module TamB domain-containing protein [Candidatus Cryosericum sp.]
MGRRRKLLIIVMAAALGAALAGTVARPMIAHAIAERARRLVEERASAGLRAPVTLAGAAVEFYPTLFLLRDLRLTRDGALGLRAGSSFERAELRGSPLAFLRWGSRPVDILIDHPRFHLVWPVTGGPAAGVPAGGADEPFTAIYPPGSTLRVRHGVVDVEALGGLLFRCEGLGLDSQPAPAPSLIAGRIHCGGGALTTPLSEWPELEGQIGFEWSPERLRLDPVILHGRGIDLSGRGNVEGLRSDGPEALRSTGEAVLGVEAASLAAWLPQESAPSGRVEARLRGRWSEGKPHVEGTVAAPSLSLFGVEAAGAAGQLSIGETIELRALEARVLDGEVRGDIVISPDPAGGYEAGATLDAEDLSADRLLAMSGWTGPPLSGRVRYKGRHTLHSSGPDSLKGAGDLAFVGRLEPVGGAALPLEASVRVETLGRRLMLSGGTVTSRTVQARFEGRLEPHEGLTLKLAGATGEIGDLLPLFRIGSTGRPRADLARPRFSGAILPARLRAPGPFPVVAAVRRSGSAFPVALAAVNRGARPGPSQAAEEGPFERALRALGGRWEWNGELRYDHRGLRFEGTLAGSDLEYRGVRLGSVDAEILYEGERLTVRRAEFHLAAAGSARLEGKVDFRGAGAMDLEVALDTAPLATLLALAEIGAGGEGEVSGRGHVGGTFLSPRAQAVLETGPVAVRGVHFDRLAGEADLNDGVVLVRDLLLLQGEGSLRLQGALPLHASPDGGGPEDQGLKLTGGGFDLERFDALWPGATVSGRVARIEASIVGSVAEPAGTLAVDVEAAGVAGFQAGDARLEGTLREGRLALRGAAPDRGLELEGEVGIGGDHEANLTIGITGLTLRGPEVLGGVPEDVLLSLDGRTTISGPLARPDALLAEARFERVHLVAGEASATNEAVVEARLAEGRFEVKPAVLIGDGTRIDLRSSGDIDPEGRMEIEAHGAFDLGLLRFFVRGLHAEGRGDIELQVAGLRRDPIFRGTLQLNAPRVRYPDLPFLIDSLEGRIAFDGVGARIETLHCAAGGGRVEATGEVLIGKTGVSQGLASILAADLTIRGNGVGAQFPAGFRSLSDADLHFVFDPTGAELSGVVRLERGVYSRNFRFESTLLTGRAPAPFEMPEPQGPLGAMRLDLSILGPEQIWLRNDFGRIEGQVDLHVTGTSGRPSVAGRITAVEGGTIDFNRVRYRLLSGTVDFDDPERINPVFNLTAETSVAEYQVTLQIEGTVDKFRYELSSNPPLAQQDIVALLLTGRAPGGEGGGLGGLSPENVSSYLAGTLGQQLSTRFLGKAGPDVISIDPMDVVTQGDPTTRITLGKQITPDLRVTYTDLLGTNQGATYSLDYAIGRGLGFTSERDSDGSVGGDFRYTLLGRPPDPPGVELSTATGGRVRLREVRIEGDLRLPEDRIRRKLRARPGAKRDRAKLNDGVDRVLGLYRRKGYLTADAVLRESPATDDQVDLTLEVQAGPRIRIDIEGTRGRAALREAVEPLWLQSLFVEDTVQSMRDRVESLVRDRGWREAKVTAEVVKNDPRNVHVRLLVDAGERFQIDSLQVAGARQVREEEVLRVVRSHSDTAWHRGILRGDRLREDAAAIQTFYVSQGFTHVSVSVPEVIAARESSRATVVFRVEEGPRVSVRAARFEGASSLPPDRLQALAALPEGVPYTPGEAEAAAVRLRRTHDDAGFPDARVRVRPERVGGDADAEEVDLVFEIAEGRRQTISEVSIAGNRLTNDQVVRKALTVEPNDPLSRADLIASQNRLYRLGIFRSVELRPAPAAGAGPGQPGATGPVAPGTEAGSPAPEEDPWERTVRATVTEAAPLRQVFGLGYDSEDRLRGLYEIVHRNLFGSGRSLGLQIRASSIEQRAALLYRERGVFGGRYDLLGSAYGLDEERPAFSGRTVGVAGQLGRDVTQATRLRYRYSLKDVNLTEGTTGFEGSTVRLASVSISGVHDTRDSPFGPLRGHYLAADLQEYAEGLGSEADMVRLYMQAYGFRELAPRLVWAQAIRAGAVIPYGRTRSDPAATGDDESGVPPSERFFAGGDTTLRGIGRDLAGELDIEGDPFGGEGLFLLNEELRFPLWRSLHGVVFTDIGNVYRTLSDYTLSDLRYCIGAGLRLMTPIGPFRMEYGALIDREEGEDPGQFFFSIGQAF